MTTTEAAYTEVQINALRRLAREFRHGWAVEPDMPVTHPVPGVLMTHDFIRSCYMAIGLRDGWEAWQYGITSPDVPDYAGNVSHTTGTGRLSWQVSANGVVGIVVSRPASAGFDRTGHRPGVVVLSARIEHGSLVEIRSPETKDHRIPDVHSATWSPDGGPRAEPRHGDALLQALAAVVDVSMDIVRAALVAAGVPLSPAPDPVTSYLRTLTPQELSARATWTAGTLMLECEFRSIASQSGQTVLSIAQAERAICDSPIRCGELDAIIEAMSS